MEWDQHLNQEEPLGGWSCLQGGDRVGQDRKDPICPELSLQLWSLHPEGRPCSKEAGEGLPSAGPRSQGQGAAIRAAVYEPLRPRDKGHRLPRDQMERTQENIHQDDGDRFYQAWRGIRQPEVIDTSKHAVQTPHPVLYRHVYIWSSKENWRNYCFITF